MSLIPSALIANSTENAALIFSLHEKVRCPASSVLKTDTHYMMAETGQILRFGEIVNFYTVSLPEK